MNIMRVFHFTYVSKYQQSCRSYVLTKASFGTLFTSTCVIFFMGSLSTETTSYLLELEFAIYVSLSRNTLGEYVLLNDALPLSQVLSMSEEFRRALYANSAISLDNEIIVPDLIGTTEILSDEHREQLCRHLPARAEGYQWTLVFSTSQHGFSLNSMYRKMAKVESPILLVIEDTEGNVSPMFLNCN